MLLLGGLAEAPGQARIMLDGVLGSGLAAEHFSRMVSMQGGPVDLLEQPARYLVAPPVVRDLSSPENGYIENIDTREIGLCIVGLGGGRKHIEDSIDHRVGLSDFRLVGDSVNRGDPLVTIHAADEASWQIAAERLLGAMVVGRKTDTLPAVYENIS